MNKANLCILLVSLLGIAGFVHAKQIGTFTGSSFTTAIDVDPTPNVVSLQPAGDMEFRGNAKLLGSFSARGRADLGPFVFGVTTECNGSPFVPGVSEEFLLPYDAFQIVYTAANGDLLRTVMADPADGPSTACLSLVGAPGVSVVRSEIVGGTGRFADADGFLVLQFSADSIRNPRTTRSHGATLVGTIEEE